MSLQCCCEGRQAARFLDVMCASSPNSVCVVCIGWMCQLLLNLWLCGWYRCVSLRLFVFAAIGTSCQLEDDEVVCIDDVTH